MTGQAHPGWHHRADIDGLRALAILPILLLHAGVTGVRGGFVGVDIFFVISGYLITAIMTRDMAAGRFSLVRFYQRRAVRLVPALLVMMTATLAVGAATLLPHPLRDLGRSAVAAALFVSNIHFYLTTDYFNAAADAKPLVHSWSLAVEEQFYLVYPFLLLAVRGWPRRRVRLLLGAIALASLGFGAWASLVAPAAAFYLLPARAWELALGGLVALGALPPVAHRWRHGLCLAALALILASVVAISPRWPFPVPFALAPAIGAAVLLAYGATGPSARLLALPPLRAIGLISYSLYLWHRPVIAFWQMRFGTEITGRDSAVLILLCLTLALASYRLVERPAARRWREGDARRTLAGAMAGLLAMAAVGGGLAAMADRVRPLPPRLALAAEYLGWDATEAGRRQFGTDRCFTLPTGRPFDPHCLRGRPGRPAIMLMGDSHAAHFAQALHALRPGASILQATAAGCRPLIGGGGLRSCRGVMAQAFGQIDRAPPQWVILSARWLPFEQPLLLDTIRHLRGRGVRVLVVGPSVEYAIEEPVLVVRIGQGESPALADRMRLSDRIALDRAMATPVRASGALYVSAVAAECPHGRCALSLRDGTPLHFDHSHFTPAAARAVLTRLLPPDL